MSNFNKTFLISRNILKTYGKYPLHGLRVASSSLKQYCSLSKRTINIKINNVPLTKYILHLENEYKLLKEQTSNLQPQQEQRLLELQPVVDILYDRSALVDSILNLKDLLEDKDSEIQKLAEEEKISFEEKIRVVDEKLLETLLPTDEDDARNSVMLEVNAGVGGQEAMLFAKELFDMYCNFAEYKNWDVEIADYLTTDIGGIRHASAFLNGDRAFQYLKYEAGVHRVQRIPSTEKQGRIHTSTVSVLTLPQPTDIEINIDKRDLKIETKRASGAGGQHVNTTDSAVRITYIPTGLSVECQVDRSQIKNRALAMQKLRALLYEEKVKSQMHEIEATKKKQVRSNFRNEKIRTYNFSQDRITDHRLQGSNVHNLKVFLVGGEPLETLIDKLHRNSRIENLLEIVNQIEN
ncbi:hypothetical protein ILUMI_08874 [Ignelater luminosus]|uniref:Prokaryotic-type class I peptide chain release factors domain-containing protein n=1 Tax=Ignelater luminosus TaxID=2038154 RepID=A0A8K0D651_IGNLU|nr:hypothetical protein ILUMI_08874 [Ignelater luminosus]